MSLLLLGVSAILVFAVVITLILLMDGTLKVRERLALIFQLVVSLSSIVLLLWLNKLGWY